jgi:sugar phosphate isomerase/epimerase
MKLAFSTLACPAWSLEQIIDAAQRNDYEGLELRLLNGEILAPNLDAATRNRVRAQCAAAGLKIVCVDTSIKLADKDGQASQIRDGIAFLEMAAEWESPFIRVFGGAPEAMPKSEAVRVAAECLAALAGCAAELGITVLLETHDSFSSSAMVMDVIAHVPQAGALWDSLHPFRVGEQPAETAARLGDRCRHVHIKDGRRNGDQWELVLLGEGDVPVPAILSSLYARGYDGWLSIEWEKKWHPGLADPEIALPQHARQLRAYLAEMIENG